MFRREVVEDILGDGGLRMMEGAMEGVVDEQVASSSDDVVDENLRITSDEDHWRHAASDGRDAFKLFNVTHSKFKQLASHQQRKFLKTFLDSVSLAGRS